MLKVDTHASYWAVAAQHCLFYYSRQSRCVISLITSHGWRSLIIHQLLMLQQSCSVFHFQCLLPNVDINICTVHNSKHSLRNNSHTICTGMKTISLYGIITWATTIFSSSNKCSSLLPIIGWIRQSRFPSSAGRRLSDVKRESRSEVEVSSSCHLTIGVVILPPEERPADGWTGRQTGEGPNSSGQTVCSRALRGNSCPPDTLRGPWDTVRLTFHPGDDTGMQRRRKRKRRSNDASLFLPCALESPPPPSYSAYVQFPQV